MANFLQRVIASGAATGVAVKAPVTVAPPVPVGRMEVVPDGLQDEASSPAVEQQLTPAVRERVPPQDARRDEVAEPLSEVPRVEMPARAAVSVEATAPVAAVPVAALPVPGPTPGPVERPVAAPVLQMPRMKRVAMGTRIQAPKEWSRTLKQMRAEERPVRSVLATPRDTEVVESLPRPVAAAEAEAVEVPHVAGSEQERPVASKAAVSNDARSPAPALPVVASVAPKRSAEEPSQSAKAVTPIAVSPVASIAVPVQAAREMPVRAGGAVSRPQSRISIGRVEVQVSNRSGAPPAVAPRPATSAMAAAGLPERFGWERFAIKP